MGMTITDLLRNSSTVYSIYVIYVAGGFLVALLVWQAGRALLAKRLWLLPSHPPKLLALNAGTLALLSVVAKPATPGADSEPLFSNEFVMLLDMVLICAMLGAFIPSIASSYSTNLNDLWSNVAGVSVLVITAIVTIFLQCYNKPDYSQEEYPIIHELLHQHIIVMGCLFLLWLVFLTQVLALHPMMVHVKAAVSEQLAQLHMEKKAGFTGSAMMATAMQERADHLHDWTWESIERNTCVKLMMVLTSNPQNVLTRSPSAAIVGALVLLPVIILLKSALFYLSKIAMLLEMISIFFGLYYIAVMACGSIAVWRWVYIALQEDRPFQTLISDAEPCYWQQGVRNFLRKLKARSRHMRPNVLQEGQYGLKEVLLYTIHFLLLCSLVPIHCMLVATIRFSHILSALIMRYLIWLPIKTLIKLFLVPFKALWTAFPAILKGVLGSQNNQPVINIQSPGVTNLPLQGVVCLPGEDACVVKRQFASAANRVIKRQLKRAHTKPDVRALVSLLRSSEKSSSLANISNRSNGIDCVLDKEGAPHVNNLLDVEHGYQFGWGLTIVSLLDIMIKIEVETLELPEIYSEGALDAFWQAMEMVKLVDEQYTPCNVCSEETYATAFASEWSKLCKKKKRTRSQRGNHVVSCDLNLQVVEHVLKSLLEQAKIQIEEFNEAKLHTHGAHYVAAQWPLQTVVAYTKHTLCQNLLRWWTCNCQVAGSVANSTSCEDGDGGRSEATKIVVVSTMMLQHIKALIAELLACCLLSLSTALERSTTCAVKKGSISKIEKGLFLIGQAKHVWTELQWPATYTPADSGVGQLRHWIHAGDMPDC